MDGQLTRHGGLVRCFTEFSLLPDLLGAYRPSDSRDAVVEGWGRLLDDVGYNADHVEDRFIPEGQTLTRFIAEDALQLCERISLIGSRGAVTPAGRPLISIARKPYAERGADESQALTKTLARQIQFHYRGHGGLRLTELLQRASVVLASHGQPWLPILGGLLLAEMDTLLHWGLLDAVVAERLARRLASLRQRAIDAMREVPAALNNRGRIKVSAIVEVVSEMHWRDPALAQGSGLTTTELKATAMALAFSQLLSHTLRHPEIQVLKPWTAP